MEKVTENTLVPIGSIAALCATLAGGIWWASAMYVRVSQAETNISSLQTSHSEIVKELREVNGTLIEIRTVLKKDKH